MKQRTTIEIDVELLDRARRPLGISTARATVDEALRRAAETADAEQTHRATGQWDYGEPLGPRIDPSILGSDEMWR